MTTTTTCVFHVAPITYSHHSLISNFRKPKKQHKVEHPKKPPGFWSFLFLPFFFSHLLVAKLTFSGIRALATIWPFAGKSHVPILTLTKVLDFATDPRVFPSKREMLMNFTVVQCDFDKPVIGTRHVVQRLLVECYSVSVQH